MRKSAVFCLRYGEGERCTYDGFMHQLDVLFLATASEVEAGTLSAEMASDEWLDYYEDFIADEDNDLSVAPSDGLLDSDEAEDDGDDEEVERPHARFPTVYEIWDSEYGLFPATRSFHYDAEEAYIDGVGEVLDNLSPASGLVWHVRGAAAMQQLRAALKRRYKIVVMKNADYAIAPSVEAAEKIIEEARRRRKLE